MTRPTILDEDPLGKIPHGDCIAGIENDLPGGGRSRFADPPLHRLIRIRNVYQDYRNPDNI